MRLETVRNIRGTIQNREIDSGDALEEDEILKLIRGLVKQRDEAIVQYRDGGRDDLAENESREKAILEDYLPAAPSAEDVERVVAEVIDELSAASMKQMGQVMKVTLQRLGPAADGKLVSAAVKAKLSS